MGYKLDLGWQSGALCLTELLCVVSLWRPVWHLASHHPGGIFGIILGFFSLLLPNFLPLCDCPECALEECDTDNRHWPDPPGKSVFNN